MNIKIICLGKIKEQSLANLINEYKKRISKYATLDIIELSDEPIPNSPSEKEILNIKKEFTPKMAEKHIKGAEQLVEQTIRILNSDKNFKKVLKL